MRKNFRRGLLTGMGSVGGVNGQYCRKGSRDVAYCKMSVGFGMCLEFSIPVPAGQIL